MKNKFFDKYLGTKFNLCDSNGFYLGCMLPIYLLYPDSYRFIKPNEGFTPQFILKNILNYCTIIDIDRMKFGDFIITKFRGQFHFFLFVEGKKFVHIQENGTLEYTDINFRNQSSRILGVFTVNG